MQDKYYGFDTYEEDIISNANYVVDKAMEDPEFMAENFDTFVAAWEVQKAADKIVRNAQINKVRLNQNHVQKLRRGKIWGLIAGTAFGVSVLMAAHQVEGSDFLANKAYGIMQESGYGWRDDSQSGLIFNKNGNFVDYNTAINDIVDKCESIGMSNAEIDIALDAVLHIQPSNSTVKERVTARTNAYHESKLVDKGMSK